MARFTAKPEVLYLGDNGHCYCGDHLGSSAKYTGRDISGQRIMAVTPDVVREIEADPETRGWRPTCEECGRTPSALYIPA